MLNDGNSEITIEKKIISKPQKCNLKNEKLLRAVFYLRNYRVFLTLRNWRGNYV